MADIPAGPDYIARVLASTIDEDDVVPGEVPSSAMEKMSDQFAEARRKAMLRATATHKPVKVTTTITITDIVVFGSGDAAKLETAVACDIKTTKAPPIKARGSWVDREGNQLGRVEKQTTIQGIDGGKADDSSAKKARKQAV